NLSRQPLLIAKEKGLLKEGWAAMEIDENTLPTSFNFYHLQRFLKNLWSQSWTAEAHYQRIITFQQFDKTSVYFFKPIHPPRRTVICGRIQSPRVNEVDISGFLAGSQVRTWGRGKVELDEFGYFKLTTDLEEPTIFNALHEWNGLVLYLEPGDSLFVEIDANAFYRKVQFSGNQTMANQFLLDFYHEMRGDTTMSGLDRYLLRKTQLEFLNELRQKERREMAFLENRRGEISPEFFSHFERRIRFFYAQQIWYNATWFYKFKDAEIDAEYKKYAQSLEKYLFRLPKDPNYDFDLDQYLEFQAVLLQGAYVKRRIAYRQAPFFELAKLTYSPENIFRFGRLLLTFGHQYIEKKHLNQVYEDLKEIAQLETDLLEIADFKDPNLSLPLGEGFRVLNTGEKAPNWAFANSLGDTIRLSDFLGQFCLVHIGVAQNLRDAQTDLQAIKTELDIDLPTVSIVEQPQQPLDEKLYDETVLFVSDTQMRTLRDSYRIDNRGNNYYLIDSTGTVAASPFDLNSFHKLKSAIAILPKPTPRRFWQPTPIFWRNLGIIAVVLLLLSAVHIQRKRVLAQREKRRRQLVELELKGIRAQMNPHFLFNALSSIQNLIRKKEDTKADRYLTQFAGLVRKILRNSEQEFITLEEEMAAIRQYCSLEALRTPFDYDIQIDENIDAFNTYLPSMLLQPIVENAILHGLMPKKGAKNLWINIEPHPDGLACTVTDNGIGVEQSKKQQQRHKAHQKSFGMALIRQRLQLLQPDSSNQLLSIRDRSTIHPTETGTIVQLIIPTEK
ncbi:MAG: histidine kinase, partial [Bacteroidota bacterium]